MHPGRMRNGFCWSAARLGGWTVVGCAGGQSPGALGAPGGRPRDGPETRAEKRGASGPRGRWRGGPPRGPHRWPTLIFCEGFELEHACRDPKDGELCLSGAKPEETLVEARSDTAVQIVRLTWV